MPPEKQRHPYPLSSIIRCGRPMIIVNAKRVIPDGAIDVREIIQQMLLSKTAETAA